jgi:protein-disulfide isomerase
VTIVEYSDFQCPYCRRDVPVLQAVLRKYDGQVRLMLKQAPLEIHPHARAAASMFEAVLRQNPDQAWRLHDLLFANQERLGDEGARYLETAVRTVGADLARARRDADGPEVAAVLAGDQAEFQRFGFTGTPGFLIDGVMLDGARPVEAFDKIIQRALASHAPPPGLTRPGGNPAGQ